jgi:hypothetical protein
MAEAEPNGLPVTTDESSGLAGLQTIRAGVPDRGQCLGEPDRLGRPIRFAPDGLTEPDAEAGAGPGVQLQAEVRCAVFVAMIHLRMYRPMTAARSRSTTAVSVASSSYGPTSSRNALSPLNRD